MFQKNVKSLPVDWVRKCGKVPENPSCSKIEKQLYPVGC